MTSPPHRFTVTYAEPMLRDAVRTFMRRRVLGEQPAVWFVCLMMPLLVGWLVWSGERSWFVGVLGAVCLIPALFVLVLWRAHHVNTIGKLRRMSRREAEIGFAEPGIEVASELGSGTIAWRAVTEVWERPAYWMVFAGRAQFNVIPRAGVPDEARDFLRTRVPVVLQLP